MPTHVTYSAPSQRRHYRLTAPISIIIDGEPYNAIDWSLAGFKIRDFARRTEAHEILDTYIKISFQGFDVGFQAKAQIVRTGEGREIAATFIDLSNREQTLLESFARGIISGEMEPADGVIRRLDVPITPALLKPKPLPANDVQARRERGIRIYMVAGLLLTVFLLAVIYTNFLQMKITTAIAIGQNEVLITPANGNVELLSELGKDVTKGTPLITITDPKLEDDIQSAMLKVQNGNAAVAQLDSLRKLESKRMSAAGNIVAGESKAANSSVAALKNSIATKQQAIARTEDLIKQGYASQTALDKLKSDYFDLQRQLGDAQRQASGLAADETTVKSGFQVQNQMVQRGTQDVDADYQAAIQNLAAANAQLDFLNTQRAHLTIHAPTDGRLVRLFNPIGGSAKFGEPLAIFEQHGKRGVQAFLTQDEAMHISVGQPAKIYVHGHWSSIPHKVTDIDYYTLSLGQNHGRLEWQNYLTDTFKTVIVTLEPVDNSAEEDMLKVPSGSASTVVFSRF